MKRDMDLIRKILLATEDLPYGGQLSKLEGVPEEEFITHALWLKEAGLIEAIGQAGSGSYAKHAIVSRLTWQGTEFVSAMRDETLWAKAKKNFIGEGMSFTLDLLKAYLAAEIAKRFTSGQ